MTGRYVEFECRKVGVGEIWPRLTESNQKLGWLRPDFDKFAFDDSEGSSSDEDKVILAFFVLFIFTSWGRISRWLHDCLYSPVNGSTNGKLDERL